MIRPKQFGVLHIFLCLAAVFMVQCVVLAAGVDNRERQGVYLAPGWGKLSFKAPAAGSYKLPVIDQAADGQVLDTKGRPAKLHELLGEKVTLLSFIYRTCDDVNGCPLSTMVLYSAGNRLAEQADFKDSLRILTMSFDPEFDTPEVMEEFGEDLLGDSDLDWHFLTTQSEQELDPILDAYQQSVIADTESEGGRKKFSHILRVYLIDAEKRVRNIYSLSFLHPDIVVNDIKTLLMEQQKDTKDPTQEKQAAPTATN